MARFLPPRTSLFRASASILPISASFSWYKDENQEETPRFDRRRTAAREKKPGNPDIAKKKFSDFYFTFGPNNSYYYRGPRGTCRSIPPQHDKYLIGDPDEVIEWVVWNSEDIYAISLKPEEPRTWYCRTNAAITRNLPHFCSFLDTHRNDKPYAVLGPNKSYILWCRDSKSTAYSVTKSWEDIESLCTEKRISLVALGYGSAYYIRYEDGSAAWDLKDQYPSLAIALDAIERSDELEVKYLAMDASQSDMFFMLLNNDSVSFYLHSDKVDRIKKAIQRDGLSIRTQNC